MFRCNVYQFSCFLCESTWVFRYEHISFSPPSQLTCVEAIDQYSVTCVYLSNIASQQLVNTCYTTHLTPHAQAAGGNTSRKNTANQELYLFYQGYQWISNSTAWFKWNWKMWVKYWWCGWSIDNVGEVLMMWVKYWWCGWSIDDVGKLTHPPWCGDVNSHGVGWQQTTSMTRCRSEFFSSFTDGFHS